MPKLRVEYFAVFREQRGLAAEDLETAASTPSQLYEELRGQHGLSLDAAYVRFAVNDRFAPPDQPLQSGDTVVFVPPVAGG